MRNERAFAWAYDVLGCLPPDAEPRATGHVPEMIVLMQRLIDAGHAYAADGDVYFDVGSWPQYGELSGQRVDEMQAAADSTSDAKRDPRDFALWKAAKPGEPSWPTPWGDGASRLAPGVLGDGAQVPGRGVRHPRRRARPGVPAPRERDRAEQGGRRPLRVLLAAQLLGDDVAARR